MEIYRNKISRNTIDSMRILFQGRQRKSHKIVLTETKTNNYRINIYRIGKFILKNQIQNRSFPSIRNTSYRRNDFLGQFPINTLKTRTSTIYSPQHEHQSYVHSLPHIQSATNTIAHQFQFNIILFTMRQIFISPLSSQHQNRAGARGKTARGIRAKHFPMKSRSAKIIPTLSLSLSPPLSLFVIQTIRNNGAALCVAIAYPDRSYRCSYGGAENRFDYSE